MRVAFIYLPHPYLKQPDSQVPIGLLYLAAVLENNDIEVCVKNYSSYSTCDAIEDLPESDVYGITCTSLELKQANRFACLIKKKYRNSLVGLGGPGTITDEFIDWNVIDFACKGEAEKTILDILSDIEKRKLKLMYVGEPIDDIDSIPFPSRHLLGKKQGGNIFAYSKMYKENGTTVIMTSRGCPYKCAFCCNPKLTEFGGGVRYRSVDNVIEEMKEVIAVYGIKQFRISDDLFTSNSERCLELCGELSKLDIVWRISARTKPFDKELAEALHNGNCKEVSFGVESFDDTVLKLLNKKTTAEDNSNALRIAIESGLNARCLMMIRTPGQTPETILKNMEYIKKTPFTIAACTLFVPMPGSDIWYRPDAYGIEILNRNLDDYNFYFFGSHGENKLKDIIKLKNRPLLEFNQESIAFKDYLKMMGRLNEG